MSADDAANRQDFLGEMQRELAHTIGHVPRSESSPSAATTHGVSLMEGLRNLEKGYDRKFALSYCANDVWRALEALEKIAGGEYADTAENVAQEALS